MINMRTFKDTAGKVWAYSDKDLISIGRKNLPQKFQTDEKGDLIYNIIKSNQSVLDENKKRVMKVVETKTAIKIEQKDEDCTSRALEILTQEGKTEFSYTDEEIAAAKFEQDKNILIGQAETLLSANDYRQLKALSGLYSDAKKQAVFDYAENLRLVIREARKGNLLPLPTFEDAK
jgi:hypothetical protein